MDRGMYETDQGLHDDFDWGDQRETGRPLLNGNDQVAPNHELESLNWRRCSQSVLSAALYVKTTCWLQFSQVVQLL